MRRRALALALVGAALIVAAVALAVTQRKEPLGPDAAVQVGGDEPGDVSRAATTPVLAVDPTDARRLLLVNRIELPRFSCDVFASADGGTTWRRSELELPDVGERCYAPYAAFGSDGRAYVSLTMLEGRGNEPYGIFLYESRDGGATFGRPRQILPEYTFQTSLVPGPDGALHAVSLAATEFSRHATFGFGPPPNPVTHVVSRDGGRTFGDRTIVSEPEDAYVGGPVAALGPEGEIYVLYWDFGDDVFTYHAFRGRYGGHYRLVLAVSRDDGRAFETHVVEPEAVPARSFLIYLPPLPALAVDRETGALFAAWEDGRSGSSDILLRRSDDGGATWTEPVELFSGPTDERMPALAVEPGERLVTVAYRLGARGRTELALRVSRDGGETFSAPSALTPAPFDARVAPSVPNSPDQFELGSRVALVARGGRTLAAWADTRGGTVETRKMDILLARVPDDLPVAGPLPPAREAPEPEPSRADRRLGAECVNGPRVDSRRSALAVVRSFASALDRGELRRAYGYFEPAWRRGEDPVTAPHPFHEFAREHRSLTCVQIVRAESYDRSADGTWDTFRVWLAVRRGDGPTRLAFGLVWAHTADAEPPWSLINFWFRESTRRGVVLSRD